MLRRQLAERQQVATAQGGRAAPAEPPRLQRDGGAQRGTQQRVLGLDGSWVEQTWVTVHYARFVDLLFPYQRAPCGNSARR